MKPRDQMHFAPVESAPADYFDKQHSRLLAVTGATFNIGSGAAWSANARCPEHRGGGRK